MNYIVYYDVEKLLSDVGVTDPIEIKGASFGSVQTTSSENDGTITFQLEVSNDGTNWIPLLNGDGAELEGNVTTLISIVSRTKYLRCRFVSGEGILKFNYIGGN